MTFVWKDFLEKNVTAYNTAIVIGTILSTITVVMTIHLIYKHFKYYCQPDHQRYIVRIIFMIPIYSIFTLLSIIFHKYEIYLALVRDCYESYVIYSFFALLISYGGGDSSLVTHFIAHEPISVIPIKSIEYKYKPNEKFLQYSRISILQYVIIKPISTTLVVILTLYDKQGNSFMDFKSFYPYNMTITFFSVGLALYFVMLFLKVSNELVAPFKPVLKFLSVKVLIGVIFWQYIILIGLDTFGFMPKSHEMTPDELIAFLCNCLILIEMLFCAILHLYAYPYELYRVMTLNSAPLLEKNFHSVGSIFNNVVHSIKQTDMIEETIKSIKGTNICKKGTTTYDGIIIDGGNEYDQEFDIAPIEMGEFHNGYEEDFEMDPEILKIINSGINNKNNITSIGVYTGRPDDDNYLSDDFFFSMMNSIKSNDIEIYNNDSADNHDHMVKIKR